MNLHTGLLIIASIFLNCENSSSSKPIIKTIKATQFGLSENGKADLFLTRRLDIYRKENLIDRQEYYSESGNIKSKWKYFYDGNKQLKFIEYDAEGNIISEYFNDYEPYVKLEIKKFTSGLLEKTTLVEYEAKHIARQTIFDKVGDVIQKDTYEYNDKNQLIKNIHYAREAHMTWIYWYEYDEKGNMTKRDWSDEVGYTLYTSTFSYVFDENQNWIRKETYEDGKLEYLDIRELEYFD